MPEWWQTFFDADYIRLWEGMMQAEGKAEWEVGEL